jgi:DNA-binding beta-propeller fold protein YncE
MRATLLMIVLAMVLTGCATAPPPDLYALNARDNTLHGVRFDGASSFIGRIAPVGERADLAMLTNAGESARGEPLALTIDRRANVLHTIGLNNAAVVASVKLDMDVWVTRRGLAMSPDGTLYALLPGMDLRTIDPTTGATAIVGPVSGATMIEALAFSPDGELFALGSAGTKFSNALYRIDTLTAEATHVADLDVPDADALAYAGGFLYAADSDGSDAQLWQIDPATGAMVSLGATGIATLNGLASGPRP